MIRAHWTALLLLLLPVLFIGCTEDEIPDPEPLNPCIETTYAPGVFISNEGPFTDGSGTITYFNPDDETTTLNGFQFNNCDEELGSIVQSIAIFENNAYIIVNNSNKMIVADATTLEKTGTVENLELPRYFLAVGNDKAFVSQWGANGVDGSVAVVDLSSLTVVNTIPCGAGPENMVQVGDKVYVANVGGFDRDSTVTVIDVNSESVVSTIVAGDNPQSFVIDNIGSLWVLSRGYTDWVDPNNSTSGQLSLIENDQVQKSIDIANGASWLAINNAGDNMYYVAPGGIFTTTVTDPSIPTTPLITGNFYAMAIDFNTNQIYASDAVDFSSAGTVYRYAIDGSSIDSFTAGIIPGGFWFE